MEIDFVAQNSQGNTYIQVAASVRDENTLKRELRSLQTVKDNYPKMIFSPLHLRERLSNIYLAALKRNM